MAKNLPAAQAQSNNGSVATTNRKALGAGYEEVDAETFAIPFLSILQANSPQLVDGMEGAKPGMFIDSVTNELFVTVEVIPCYYNRRFNRWAPRETGGGFGGQFNVDQVTQMESEKQVVKLDNRIWFPLPDGTVNEKKCDRLSDTRNHYVLVRNADGDLTPALLSLASTQIKKSKQWMTKIRMKGGDIFDYKYVLATTKEQNDKGQWYGLAIGVPVETSEEERAEARDFYKSIVAGRVEVKHEATAENE